MTPTPTTERAERAPTPADPAEATPPRELAPLAPVVVSNDERFNGSPGRIRGSLQVRDVPFEGPWELVLGPSLTLVGREHATERRLEMAPGSREFDLQDLPLGGYDLAARAPGFNGPSQPILLEKRQSQVFVTLTLEPAGFLEGTVVNTGGLPLPGVTFSLLPVTGELPRLTESDAAGRYRFDAVTDGAYELVVGHHESPILPDRRSLRFQAPSLTVPEIELPPLAGLDIQTIDERGEILPGVSVRGSGNRGGRFEGVTGADGRLPVRYLPPGRYRVSFELEGFEDMRAPYELEAGTVRDARIVLYR